jgi:hypothetical protein
MEWFVEDPRRGKATLTIIALVLAIFGLWLGRKRLLVTSLTVLAFLFLAAISIPSCIPARSGSQRIACIANLRALQNAKAEWARSNNKLSTDIPLESDLYSTNDTGSMLRHFPDCPRGGIYSIGSVAQNPTCTFSNKGHLLP